MPKHRPDRGRIEELTLQRSIVFNGNLIRYVVIEIDHINYGLDKKTQKLKVTPRTNFRIKDIEKFMMMLDGEWLVPERYKENISIFAHRIDCPVSGPFFRKEFLMIFQTDYNDQNQIYTVTLYPIW